jgi:2-polyprenyl-6-methoxyphenol hydroxylase-like FAD-dependent oxidoreductase
MPRSVLISGAGIAGTTLAYWLQRRGFEPTIVERAPAFRQGGQIIDFWGLGFDVAERMGLVPALRERGYVNDRAVFVAADGRRTGGFGAQTLQRSLGDRFMSLQRGDLAKVLFDQIESAIEVRFGDEITALEETSVGVTVAFRNARPRSFDLVVGADGLHSGVRRLAFQAVEPRAERFLGYFAAVLVSAGYPTGTRRPTTATPPQAGRSAASHSARIGRGSCSSSPGTIDRRVSPPPWRRKRPP